MAVLPYPVIRYPGGAPSMIDLWDYEPGYAAPEIIHDNTGRNFKLDPVQKAYVPLVEPKRPRPAPQAQGWGNSFMGDVGAIFYVLFLIGAFGCVLAVAWPLVIPVLVIAGIVKLVKALR